MVKRLFIGNDTGGFKLRISKNGFDAQTAAVENLLIYENMLPEASYVTGTASVPAGSQTSGQLVNPSSVTVNLGRTYTSMPKIILRCDQNFLPSGGTYFCGLTLSTGILRLYNRTLTPIVVRYAVFAPQVPTVT